MAGIIGAIANTSVLFSSNSVDKLTFEQGTPITFKITQATLAEGSGNVNGMTTSNAKLVANNNTTQATELYNVYFDIQSNQFIYTTYSKEPEIILTIKDQNNNNLTTAPGLTYVTKNGVSGFDITDKNGKLLIKNGASISTNSHTTGTTHTWTAIVTFINLDSDQGAIVGKSMQANLILGEHQPIDEIILANNGGKTVINAKTPPNFNNIATTNEGLFAMTDDYGTSYYFRGAVDNNWVYFAGYYWRIVRINGDGSVKLIYTGTVAPTTAEKTVMTGTKTGIGTSAVNSSSSRPEYIGYMYTLGQHREHGTNSTIKTYIDTWYEDNLENYEEYLSDSLFCNDRNFIVDSWTPINTLPSSDKYSDVYRRLYTNKNPTLICAEKEDSYTASGETRGNGQLTNPIGLLTGDEVSVAGGKFGTSYPNSAYYLYTNQTYWLISPCIMYSSSAGMFRVQADGAMTNRTGIDLFGVRPVISLKPNIVMMGSGQWNDPYVIGESIYKDNSTVSFADLSDIPTTIQDFEGRNYLRGTQEPDFNIASNWVANTTASVYYEGNQIVHRAVPKNTTARYGYLQNTKYQIDITESMTISFDGRGSSTAHNYNYYISSGGNLNFGSIGSWNSSTFTRMSKYLNGLYRNGVTLLIGSVDTTPSLSDWSEIKNMTLNKGNVSHPYQLAPEDLKHAKEYTLPNNLTNDTYTIFIDNKDHNWIGVWLGTNHFAGYFKRGGLTFQGIETNKIILKSLSDDIIKEVLLFKQ